MLKLFAQYAFRLRRKAAFHRNLQPRASVVWLACLTLLLAVLPLSVAAQSGTQLSSGSALYARLLRLSYNPQASLNGGIVASVNAFPGSGAEEDIYSSTDGVKFTQIGAITDPDFAGGLCCGTLYELPSKVGALAPGTLLWAGSVGQSSTTQAMQIKVYQSADQGKTWSYLSNCAKGTNPGTTSGGLWEPQFTVAGDGALVCIYSDETQAGHSQLLRQIRSYDGINWQDATFTVASSVQADRPGMAVVTKLPSGTYFMSYELCGPAACTVFYRTSADGWNWGDATNMGTKVATAAGQYFEHAPTNAWAPSAASSNGTILLVGQVMNESNNAVSSGNGITIFTNHSADGSGPWSTMPAPVQVPAAYDNYCPNYSSPLLPSIDGQSVLEFASRYSGATCLMYYATAPILAGSLTPAGVTVTPASASITTAQSASVTIAVAGATNGPTPTGTITLSGGGYTSSATSLSSGSASITIPANALAAGTDTLTATYSGDANYLSASGTASIAVTQAPNPSFTISAGNLSVKAGATSSNSTTITIAPTDGFTGSVMLTAQITSGPIGAGVSYPILALGAGNPVSITGTSSGTITLTIFTNPVISAQAKPSVRPGGRFAAGWLTLAGVFPFCILVRRSRIRSFFLCLVCVAVLAGCISGCGGGGPSTFADQGGTPTGSYIVTITGTSNTADATGAFTLTVQ